jgi:hypothetical protein
MPVAAAPASAPDIASAASEPEEVAPAEEPGSLWLAHRQLIRATLPRVDGEPPPARPIPEFTMHQRQGRGPGSGYRSGHSWHGGNGQSRGGNGFRPERNGNVADPPRGNGGIGGGRPGRHRGRGRRPR